MSRISDSLSAKEKSTREQMKRDYMRKMYARASGMGIPDELWIVDGSNQVHKETGILRVTIDVSRVSGYFATLYIKKSPDGGMNRGKNLELLITGDCDNWMDNNSTLCAKINMFVDIMWGEYGLHCNIVEI